MAARPRLVALVGPTAGGKTELALALSPVLGGEVVSVDSRQIYRRLDIGTAKPDREARALVPHHLLDVVDPDEGFDAARYARLAREAVGDILSRGRRVMLCGGSGLYLRALTDGLCPAPPADPEVRAALAQERDDRGLAALHDELAEIDAEAAQRISPRDFVRIMRALEVFRLTGRPLSDWQRAHAFEDRPYQVLTLVLSPPAERLDARIAERAAAMWQAGLVEETREMLAAGFSPELAPLQAIGYREAQLFLRGEIDSAAALESICLATRQYAKRQRTWFRRLEGAVWLDGAESPERLHEQIRRFLDGEDEAS